MKRIGGLFDQVVDARNLALAAWRAARGKRQRHEVHSFMGRLDGELATMGAQLRDGEYRFAPYREFEIRDPKSRTIHAPPFRDRVVHHALIAVVGPCFEMGAIPWSYACRAGRGQHAALRRARLHLRRRDWFLKVDVARYYDSVPHPPLRRALGRRFRERRLLDLFDRLLDSYQTKAACGLPIGALTSQYLGNFFLDPVDWWAIQTPYLRGYVRYMDDMLFLGDPAELRRVQHQLPELLTGLGLRAKDGGVLNRVESGIPFLGFVLYPDRVRLNRQGRRRLRSKWGRLEKAWQRGEIGDPVLQARTESLFAHARFADDAAWRRAVCGFTRIGEALEQPDEPGSARRLLEQPGQELSFRHPQQEQGGQSQQEQRVSGLSGSRHGGAWSPDDAPSRALAARTAGDETTHKTPPSAEIRPERGKKGYGGAARQREEDR